MKNNIIIKFLFFLVLTTFVLAKDYELNVTEDLSFGNVKCGLSCFLDRKAPIVTAKVQIINNSTNNTQLYLQLPIGINLISTNNATQAVVSNIGIQGATQVLYPINSAKNSITDIVIIGSLNYTSSANYSGLFTGTIVAELTDGTTIFDTANINVTMEMNQTKEFTETQPLSFGTIVPNKNAVCSVTINPSGSYTNVGCMQVEGTLTQGIITTYTDTVANIFNLSFPTSVQLINTEDNSYLELTNFQYTQSNSALPNQTTTINVGATLTIDATNQNYSGNYTGSIEITINY